MAAWIAALEEENELRWREREVELDRQREHALGREQAERVEAVGDEPEWPWYADPWWDVQEPEVFEL